MAGHLPSCKVRGRQRGFTYFGVLFALVLIGMALATAGTVSSVETQRQREQQLLWSGNEIRLAIARYYAQAPEGLHYYPRDLSELLEDRRGPVMLRHLRRIYLDPMTGLANWDLVLAPDGTILGVSSTSTAAPIKRDGFGPADEFFRNSESYHDWRFVYLPQLTRGAPP